MGLRGAKGHDIWMRVNLANGAAGEAKIDATEFRFHPDNERDPTDVAVIPMGTTVTALSGEVVAMDVRPIPINGEGTWVPNEDWSKRYFGLGSDVAIVGLFRSHFGKDRNVPILRVGNVAAMPDEPFSLSIQAMFLPT